MPDEFGRIEIEFLQEMPEYLFVSSASIDKDIQRQGYGTQLYQYALQFAKEKGYKGIVSDRGGRSKEADKLWHSLSPKANKEFDVLELTFKQYLAVMES